MARIAIITAGHLATCPRMTKAADTLASAGHQIRVISTRHTPWAVNADEEMRRSRSWDWRVVDYRADGGGVAYLTSGLRGRIARVLLKGLGAQRIPFEWGVHAYARVHTEIVRAAVEKPVDLYYGGTTGALAATAAASAETGVPYGLDLEDFHAEEQEGADGPILNALAERILKRVVPQASFLTTSSANMASEYERRFGARAVTVNNTFPLPAAPPTIDRHDGAPLKAYWFSQTIGAGRGFEGFLAGARLSEVPIELHLRGRPAPGYVGELKSVAASIAPRVSIVTSDPAPPDDMVALCRDHDFGLAIEDGQQLSRQLALSNKALTYILAGLAVVLTDTEGQRDFARELGEGALVYRQGDPEALAEGLRRWYRYPERLVAARRAAWAAAVRHWHWEHPSQSGALVAAVESALG